jgi:CubicO group peptidase (beta-lactamase class C family)
MPRQILLAVLLALGCMPRLSQPCHGAAKPADNRALDAAVARAMKTWSVPGASVVIVQDGKVLYLKGHGLRQAGKKDAVTPDTLFCLGSCSKAFTTAIMALLAHEGKLAWDDRVRDRLPIFRLSDPLADREVRLRDLVCHRTGLANSDLLWYRASWSPQESVRRLGHLPLARPFRTAFQYNSTTFTAAGLAAARAAGTDWPGLMRKRLLDPLGMKRTCLSAAEADRHPDRARGHRLDRAGDPVVMQAVNMRQPDPAGSIHASARDLIPWLRFHLDEGRAGGKELVPARALRVTHTPQMVLRQSALERSLFPDTVQTNYAMGWVVLDHRGLRLLAHGGELDGQRTQIILVPEKKLGLAVLSNLHQTPMNLALAFTLLESVLDLPRKRDWNALHQAARMRRAAELAQKQKQRLARRKHDTKPSRELAAYAGAYEHPAFEKVVLSVVRGRLVWEWRGEREPLEHFHYDTFTLSSELVGEADLVFSLDRTGAVKRFHISGHFNLDFVRSKER